MSHDLRRATSDDGHGFADVRTGVVAWFTGLTDTSSVAAGVAVHLRARGVPVAILDGDAVRGALAPLGAPAPDAFYLALASLAALLAQQGLVVLVPAIAERRAYRNRARTLAPAFLEVFVDDAVSHADYEPPPAPDFLVTPTESTGAASIAARLAIMIDG